MTNENSYSKVHLYAEGIIAVLLLIVIALLSYEVFKPPLVSKNTIEELKKSAQSIENYTKELQVTASLSRQQVTEDDALSYEDKVNRDSSYGDLLSRYGIFEDDKSFDYSQTDGGSIDTGNADELREATESK